MSRPKHRRGSGFTGRPRQHLPQPRWRAPGNEGLKVSLVKPVPLDQQGWKLCPDCHRRLRLTAAGRHSQYLMCADCLTVQNSGTTIQHRTTQPAEPAPEWNLTHPATEPNCPRYDNPIWELLCYCPCGTWARTGTGLTRPNPDGTNPLPNQPLLPALPVGDGTRWLTEETILTRTPQR